MKEIRIASRPSRLALAQANEIKALLSSLVPEYVFNLVEISTKGDRDRSDFLYKSKSVGFFTSEVERTLLDGRADIAVHSLKDLPTAMTEGLTIAAIPQREAVNDVIITSKDINSIQDLPNGATVGTSSVRRISQLKLLRSDLNCQPLRGNVETRIRKVHQGHVDAIVIAQAGVNRLGLSDQISLTLPLIDFIPAPGQGALAVQVRNDNEELCELVSKLDHQQARITTQTERKILAGLHGGCSIPLGVHSTINNNILYIDAILCNLSGTKSVRKSASCLINDVTETATTLTQQIFNEGGKEILEDLKSKT